MGTLTDFTFNGNSLVCDVFVETGTYLGATLIHALQAGFKELHSIEVNDGHYQAACQRFQAFPQVHLYRGSSPTILPRILDGDKATLIWLDAHYQGQECYGSEIDMTVGQCPVLAELSAINSVAWTTKPIILIDDSYYFQDWELWSADMRRLFDYKQWPRLQEIVAALPGYDISDRDCRLFCVPKSS